MNGPKKTIEFHGTEGTTTSFNGTKIWRQEDPTVPDDYWNNILEGNVTSRHPVNEASTLYKGDAVIVFYSIVN
jgi:hypothetical protein